MSKDEQQQRGGFVSVGDLAIDLPDVPVLARRDRRRQARHFTQLDLPYGIMPRLLLAWVCTEAVRTQSRELVLGRSLSEFMRSVGVYDDGGIFSTSSPCSDS